MMGHRRRVLQSLFQWISMDFNGFGLMARRLPRRSTKPRPASQVRSKACQAAQALEASEEVMQQILQQLQSSGKVRNALQSGSEWLKTSQNAS